MKAHLLFEKEDFDFGADLPPNHEDLIQDLELPSLLEAMSLGDKFLLDVSTRVLLTAIDDEAIILYRQRVLADCIAEPDIIRQIYAVAVDALLDRRGFWGYSSQNPTSILSGAVSQLEASVGRLRQLREIADEHASRFGSEGMTKLFSTVQHELDDEYFQTVSHHFKRLRFRDGVLISAELDRSNSGVNFVLRSPGDGKARWRERLGIGPRSSYSFTIPPRDEAGGQALADLNNRGVNLVANAVAQSADHVLSYLTLLRAELGFYVSCLNLWDQLRAKGAAVSFPEPLPWRPLRLSSTCLRDVSLTLRTQTQVVGNDFDGDGRSMIIVTGANSGGKSTFLRSVGLAQLMMQCGMFVTAERYRASVCSGVFTHFIREEDATMTSGRLDEELSRMSTIADQIRPHGLMLFNESFAATNEREGSEIGRQVSRALLDTDIKVIFVTHQYDFAESFYELRSESTLFLRAERQSDGQRSYKLVAAEPLPTSFGEDLYYRLGAWLKDDSPPVPTLLQKTATGGPR